MHDLSPDAIDVSVADTNTLMILFSNGEKRLFDLTPLLARKCYAKLNDKNFLEKVHIEYGTVTWPENIDIDPEWLYEDSTPAGA